MYYTALFQIVKLAYKTILRPLLVKAIDDPEETWDNVVLDIMDKIFMNDV